MHGLHILKNFILTITLWEWVSYLSFIDKKIEVEKSNLSKVTVSGKWAGIWIQDCNSDFYFLY